MKRKIVTIILFFSVLSISAQDIKAKTSINWETHQLLINIDIKLDKSIYHIQDKKIKAQNELYAIFPDIVKESTISIILSSNETAQDKIIKNLSILNYIENFSAENFIETNYLSEDLSHLKSSFKIDLYKNFAPIFVNHDKTIPINPILGFTASYDYTGIIIYAIDNLNLYGTDKYKEITPAVFPRLLDSEGNIFLSQNNIPVETIKKWGYMTYISNEKDIPKERVGNYPLKILASGLYGKYGTDIVIPIDEAKKILSRKNNIELLKKGKIVIICRKEQLNSFKEINVNLQ